MSEWRIKKMKLKRKLSVLAVSLTMAFLAACGQTAAAADDGAPIVLRVGYGDTVTNPRHLTAELYAAWVYEETNGRVILQLFPSAILGNERAMLEMITLGTLDMTITSQGPAASYEERFYLVGLPFLFDSTAQAGRVLDGEMGQLIGENLPDRGMRLLAFWENGLRQITNSVRPIESPADMVGMSLRTPENMMTLSIMGALGVNASPLAFAELYMALAQGAFDGQENPITNIYANNFWEVQSHIAVVNYKYETCPVIISEAVWQRLPADVQQVLQYGAIKFATVHRDMVRDGEDAMLERLAEHGMTVTHPNPEPFRAAAASVYDYWRDRLGADLVDRMIQEAAAAR
jgi:tripartite ATP-independent transporter DctP family solute receptor